MLRSPNVGNVLLVLGFAALVVTFFVPSWSAERVARVEERAEHVGRELHALVRGMDPATIDAPERGGALLERLRARCLAIGQPDTDLPEWIGDAGPYPTFGNKHYLFRVVRGAPPPGSDPEVALRTPLEVYAWPKTTLPPGRTVFFFPLDGEAAFTRNLSASYAGLDRAPPPGAGRRRDETNEPWQPYRSRDDERWIPLPQRES